MLAVVWIPREAAGLSPVRLFILVLLGAFCAAGFYFAIQVPRLLPGPQRPIFILIFGMSASAMGIALFLLRYWDPDRLSPYYERLSPLLWFLLALSLQTVVVLTLERFDFHPAALQSRTSLLLPFAVAFTVLVLVFLFVALTRIGLTPDSAYWGEPGVPVLGWQLILAVIGGLTALLNGLVLPRTARLDTLFAFGLWLIAVVLWLSVPLSVMHNSFYGPITPPANEPFPNSDAGYYDSMAESLLIGHPYQGEIPTRPLYIVMLTVLHRLVGEDYGRIIAGQTLVLGLIPVFLFLLAKALHGRAAGVIVALFAIFREWNTLIVSSQTRVSNTKTLLVDLPTLLLLSVACLLVLRWLARQEDRSAVAAGGIFGLLLLLRTQTILIVPLVLVLAILAYGKFDRTLALSVVLFFGGMAVAASPWLLHNYVQSGQLTLDAPFQFRIIASQYSYTGNLDIANLDLQGKSVGSILLTFFMRDPKFVLGFIASHFLATQIGGLLALPLIAPYSGLHAPMNLYWLNWDGHLGWPNLPLVIFFLIVIALGVATAWRRLRWSGLIPLAFSLGYSLANGIGRFSGWRYDLPADWIAYFYFGIGVAELLGMLMLLVGAADMKLHSAVESTSAPMLSIKPATMLGLAFLALGASPWLAQVLSAPRYADQDSARLIAALSTSPAIRRLDLRGEQIQAFASSSGAFLQSGRLLYPRFFYRNTGLASAHPWPAYAPRDYPRLGFLLLNQIRHDVIFPTRQTNGPFLHAADVIVLGCQAPDYVEAKLVLFPAADLAYLSAPLEEACP